MAGNLDKSAGSPRRARALAAGAVILALGLAAGCANRDSIVVGAVPDDYRTNHPIVVGEREKKIDIPVGISQRGLSRVQKVAVDGFIADYDRRSSSTVLVLSPAGSANAGAASTVATGIVQRLRAGGVPEGAILYQHYEASAYGETAPIRLSYGEIAAYVAGQCGRWPADLLDTNENRHYANFGCAYQNNLAAQIANPADLLGPRKPGPIDAANRDEVIEAYRNRQIAVEFDAVSEVDY